MKSKTIFASIFLAIVLILSACSSVNLNDASTSQASSTSSTVQSKLGVGILKLEGTDLAVSADQAKDLLPLWKALRVLGSSASSSQVEIAALYDQIEETLTAEQLAAIGELTWTQEELDALTAQYSAQALTTTAATTTTASSSSNTSSQDGGPGMDMGGGPGGGSNDLAVISGGSTGSQTQSTSQTSSTSQAKKTASNTTVSLNITLSGSVVTLLQTISA